MPGWRRQSRRLVRAWVFPNMTAAARWACRVARLADALGHHPDLHLRYNTVTAEVTTWDAGGLTDRDFDLACRMGRLPMRRGRTRPTGD